MLQLDAAQARGVQYMGAGLLVGLQPGDRMRRGLAQAVQVVLGAGGEHEGDGARVGDVRGRHHAFGRE